MPDGPQKLLPCGTTRQPISTCVLWITSVTDQEDCSPRREGMDRSKGKKEPSDVHCESGCRGKEIG